jgi:hypothetical protein
LFLSGFRTLLFAALVFPAVVHAASRVQAAPVPAEMRSSAFTVTVNGHAVDVAHAAASLEYVSFDTTGPVTVEITAAEKGFWDKGVDIQPWRLGLRATRKGQTIRRLPQLRPHAVFVCRCAASAAATQTDDPYL